MTSKGKKNKSAGTMRKKSGTAPKKRSKAKITEDVCFFNEMPAEQLTWCEYECCCLL